LNAYENTTERNVAYKGGPTKWNEMEWKSEPTKRNDNGTAKQWNSMAQNTHPLNNPQKNNSVAVACLQASCIRRKRGNAYIMKVKNLIYILHKLILITANYIPCSILGN